MRLSLDQSIVMRLDQRISMPVSAGSQLFSGLGVEEAEELLKSIVEDAEGGVLTKAGKKMPNGNLIDSDYFRQQVAAVKGATTTVPEFELSYNGSVDDVYDETRDRFRQLVSRLKRDEPAKPENIFSKRFLDEFDWVTDKRRRIMEYVGDKQKDFIQSPFDPLKLHALKQEDVAEHVGNHVTTVSRLISNLHITFPDSFVREIHVLIPGASLDLVQGCYVIRRMMEDERYYDKTQTKRPWKVSSEEMAIILGDEYDITVQPRTIRKYRQWVVDHLRTP